jgi:hypothetical protein
MTQTSFSYGIRSSVDAARIAQQNGDYPAPHRFEPSESTPSMCALCFATIQANKPWHITPLIDPGFSPNGPAN